MSKTYKIIEASSPYDSHVFEEIESKINQAAKDGYRLIVDSIKVFHEDRGSNEMAVCRAVAVMTKKDNTKNHKTAAKRTDDILP